MGDRERFKRWIHNIFTTQDEEIDCEQACEALCRFVDMEISGKEAARLLPHVRQHLQQCRECEDVYSALVEIAQLEAQGELPEVDELMKEVLGMD